MSDANLTNIGLLEESVLGTTPASALQLLRRTGGNITPRRSTTRSAEIRSDLRPGEPVRTQEWCEGEINFEASYGSFDSIFEGMLLEDFSSDVLVDGTTKKSYTLEDQFVDPGISPAIYLAYKGCRLSSLSLSLALESIVTGSFGVTGISFANASTSAGTGSASAASSTEVFNTVDMIEAIEEGVAGSTPAALGRVSQIDLNITRNLRPKFALGSLNPFDIGVGQLLISGSVQQYFESVDVFNAWKNFSTRQLVAELEDSAGNNLKIELPKIKYTEDPQVEIPGVDSDVMVTYNFEAFAAQADAAMIRVTRTAA